MKKKAMLLFADLFTIGGIQQYNRHLCDALQEEFSSYEFIGVSLYDSRKNKRIKGWRNIDIKYCDHTNLRPVRKTLFILKALALAMVKKPDWIICSHIDLAPLALALKKIFHIRYMLLTYGIDIWNVKNGIRYRGLKNADMIITISRHSGDILALNGVDESKIRYLYNTFDSSLFRIRPPDKKLISEMGFTDKKIILTVGRIRSEEKYKGHAIMLKVLRMLDKNYVWIVVGDGSYLFSLKNEAGKLDLDSRINFAGCVDDDRLPDYYNLCDCFAMPSKGEGFGVVFLEALACGKPVISGNIDGAREPLLDGKLGFMVDPDSVTDIAKAIDLTCSVKEDRTDPEYLAKEVEANFGTKIFNRRVREILSQYLL